MRTWLITGLSSGFDRALEEAQPEEGDRAVGTLRTEAASVVFERLVPGRSLGVLLNVTDEDAVHRVVGDVEQTTGDALLFVSQKLSALQAEIGHSSPPL